jgi:hypothetical protein
MEHGIYEVKSFKLLGPYSLEIQFDDGVTTVVNLDGALEGELYGPLKDPLLFERVKLDEETGNLVWPNGADFDPEILHDWPERQARFVARAQEWKVLQPATKQITYRSGHLTSKQFADAAKIAEQIEALERQINDLLQGKEMTFRPESSPKAPPRRGVSPHGKVVTSAPVANKDERGTLRSAVVRILKRSKKPLRTADIYDALVAQGYTFTFKEPKKILGIRLYKMLGVQRLGDGLFKAK